jgi:hypothetical protein
VAAGCSWQRALGGLQQEARARMGSAQAASKRAGKGQDHTRAKDVRSAYESRSTTEEDERPMDKKVALSQDCKARRRAGRRPGTSTATCASREIDAGVLNEQSVGKAECGLQASAVRAARAGDAITARRARSVSGTNGTSIARRVSLRSLLRQPWR